MNDIFLGLDELKEKVIASLSENNIENAFEEASKEIELTFDKTDATVVQVKLLESSADFTRIVLKNKVINAKVDEASFTN